MILSAMTSTYINPISLGTYSNPSIKYIGERHLEELKIFEFRFGLMTENNIKVQELFWRFEGVTIGGLIKDEGEIEIGAGTSGATSMSLVQAALNDIDYQDPAILVTRLPELSYEDIDTYFILGGKKEKVSLPTNTKTKNLVKWLFLNSVYLNGELLKEQFTFAT